MGRSQAAVEKGPWRCWLRQAETPVRHASDLPTPTSRASTLTRNRPQGPPLKKMYADDVEPWAQVSTKNRSAEPAALKCLSWRYWHQTLRLA